MERELQDKIAVVTGAARGIGYQIAKAFLRSNAKTVIILDVLIEQGIKASKILNETYGEGKAIFIKCDVSKDLDSVSDHIFKNYKVDLLVNNAGILDETSLRRTLEINTIAVVEWAMKFWDHMRKDNGGFGGTIVNVASIYGYESDPWVPYYKTSKHAVMGFTKTLGHPDNYKKSGVRVIAVCPGFTKSDLLDKVCSENNEDGFVKFARNQILQKVEIVGQAAADIFKVANSGTAWVIKDERPITELPLQY